MDKLRAIGFFCRAAEAGSFAAAAQSLDVVPSALSKVITALERELGFKLLHRSTRRLALTDEGRAYYEQCRQILQELEEAEVHARQGSTRAQGTLRIGLHPAMRHFFLANLATFLDACPGVRVETFITNSASAVLDEGLDVVIRIGRVHDSALVARQLGWADSVVCAAHSYLAGRDEPRRPEDLAAHRAVIYARRDEEPNTRWEFVKGRDRRIIQMPVYVVSRDGIGLIDAVAGGCGVARPFHFAVRHVVERGEVKLLLADWSGERVPVYALTPGRVRSMPAKVRAFLEFSEALVSRAQAAAP